MYLPSNQFVNSNNIQFNVLQLKHINQQMKCIMQNENTKYIYIYIYTDINSIESFNGI